MNEVPAKTPTKTIFLHKYLFNHANMILVQMGRAQFCKIRDITKESDFEILHEGSEQRLVFLVGGDVDESSYRWI
jgi:hypothetical protein